MAKSGRVFLRGMTSEHYGLKEFRAAQLAAPRVRDDAVVTDDAKVGHSGDSDQSRTWWRVGPGDDPFLTQTVQGHFVQLPPRSSNHGHRHFNPYDEQATALVIKAKSMWMYLGLIQQGRSGPVPDEDRFGPREDWSQIWTPGVESRKKVV